MFKGNLLVFLLVLISEECTHFHCQLKYIHIQTLPRHHLIHQFHCHTPSRPAGAHGRVIRHLISVGKCRVLLWDLTASQKIPEGDLPIKEWLSREVNSTQIKEKTNYFNNVYFLYTKYTKCANNMQKTTSHPKLSKQQAFCTEQQLQYICHPTGFPLNCWWSKAPHWHQAVDALSLQVGVRLLAIAPFWSKQKSGRNRYRCFQK